MFKKSLQSFFLNLLFLIYTLLSHQNVVSRLKMAFGYYYMEFYKQILVLKIIDYIEA